MKQFLVGFGAVALLAACNKSITEVSPLQPQSSVAPLTRLDCATTLPSFVTSPRIQRVNPNDPRLECWSISVPENYSNPNGKKIAVSFYKVRSVSSNVQPDPILSLPGGPGAGSYSAIANFLVPRSELGETVADLSGNRDVIAVDPRGNFPTRTGPENGITECPEAYDALYSIHFAPGSLASNYSRWKSGIAQCQARLRQQGIDLSQYHTINVVRDLEEIRKALGYQKWNLYSESYGTLTALHYMRQFPSRIRASLMDSVTLPEKNYESNSSFVEPARDSLDRLFTACKNNAACNAAYPNIRSQFFQTINNLNANPRRVTIQHEYRGFEFTIDFNGSDTMGLLAGALYRPDLFGIILETINQANQGNFAPEQIPSSIPEVRQAFSLDAKVAVNIQKYVDGGLGMKAANVCADFGAIGVQDNLAELEAVEPIWRNYAMIANVPCEVVNVPAQPFFNMPMSAFASRLTNIPSLIIAGRYDPVTPWQDAVSLANQIPNDKLVIFENLSHVPVRRNQCPRQIFRNFFDQLGNTDTSCAANEPPVQLLSPLRPR